MTEGISHVCVNPVSICNFFWSGKSTAPVMNTKYYSRWHMFVTVQFLFTIWTSRQIVSSISTNINISNISQSGGILQGGASFVCDNPVSICNFFLPYHGRGETKVQPLSGFLINKKIQNANHKLLSFSYLQWSVFDLLQASTFFGLCIMWYQLWSSITNSMLPMNYTLATKVHCC